MATLPCSPRKNEWTPVEECKEFDCPERNTSFSLGREEVSHFHEGILYTKKFGNQVEVFAALPSTDDGGASSAKSYSVFQKQYVLPSSSAKASSIFGKVFVEFNRWSVLLMKKAANR